MATFLCTFVQYLPDSCTVIYCRYLVEPFHPVPSQRLLVNVLNRVQKWNISVSCWIPIQNLFITATQHPKLFSWRLFPSFSYKSNTEYLHAAARKRLQLQNICLQKPRTGRILFVMYVGAIHNEASTGRVTLSRWAHIVEENGAVIWHEEKWFAQAFTVGLHDTT